MKSEIQEGRQQTAHLKGMVHTMATTPAAVLGDAVAARSAPIDAAGRVVAPTSIGTRLPVRQRKLLAPPEGATGSPIRRGARADVARRAGRVPNERRVTAQPQGSSRERNKAASTSASMRGGRRDHDVVSDRADEQDEDSFYYYDDDEDDGSDIVERFMNSRASSYSRSEKNLEKLYDELDKLDLC